MAALLKIASRIEAAVEAYRTVKPVSNLDKWRQYFDKEKVEAARQFRLLRDQMSGVPPALHPTLAALFVVLATGADFSEIGRTYQGVCKHSSYDPRAKFPEDISNHLPAHVDRWWEALAAEENQAREAPKPSRPLPKVRLLVAPKAPEDVEMEEVDELIDDDYVPSSEDQPKTRMATKRTTESRKRKGTLLPDPTTAKRRAGADSEYVFECDRCVKAGVVCETDPMRPCARCVAKKLGCSLMPCNEKTGKADRSKLSEADIREYRIGQLKKKRGKQPAHRQRGKDSGSGASPSGMLFALELDSGSSHSPADSPASSQAVRVPSAPFYVDVPAPPKKSHSSTAPRFAAPVAPTPLTPAAASALTAAPAAPLAPAVPAISTVLAAPTVPAAPAPTAPAAPAAPAAPTAPAALTASSTPAIVPTCTSPGGALSDTAKSPGAELGGSPPALAPALRRLLAPRRREEPVPMPPGPGSPSRRKRVDTGTTQSGPDGNLADRIRTLESRLDELDEWRRDHDTWKGQVEAALRRMGA